MCLICLNKILLLLLTVTKTTKMYDEKFVELVNFHK